MTNKMVVLSTCGSAEEAERLATRLLEKRLAACVNVVPQIRSFYWWKEKIERSEEWLLVIKTSRERFEKMRVLLEATHSYEVPELLALPVLDGSPTYLDWLDGELTGGTEDAAIG